MGFSVDFKFFADKINALVSSEAETVCLINGGGKMLISTQGQSICSSESEKLWKVEKKIDLEGLIWKVTLFVDSHSFLEEVFSLQKLVFMFIFPIVAGLAFVFTLIFSNNILIAVEKLVSAAKTMGEGNVLVTAPLDREDELGELAIEMKKSADLIQNSRTSLEEKNRDLEAYSYTLAHDLRTPLRSISSFAQILEMDAKGKLNEEENSFLERIIQASKRMSELIDDILELSRISNRDITLTHISLSDLAETIMEQFRQTHENRDADIIIAKEIYWEADAQLMRLVLENLLGNAWKYTGKKEHTQIEFGSQKRDNKTVYFVRDNGVGFDMQFVDKLFSPFQRLHSYDEYEGTGIGLASVKRMIERHFGKIWIESKVDVGTTVYFTLGVSSKLTKDKRENR
jgi:signal transduction histidine kinase